ncbi:hypothetical protein [Flavobacterium sp. I3-2]|uniref:hypothetical protein n=1 Tax=Flavobacterium sp. I3-2 TaxID=2748319 RepID=UPI0015AA6F6D|nr:hypothetical protein [Flavobacterium sp. I3-2]
MSDNSISIVPKISNYPENHKKAKEILDWLQNQDVVQPTLSDCILSSEEGYAISEGATTVTNFPRDLPFNLIVNGLEITLRNEIFHAGEYGLEECICPKCKVNIALKDWSFLDNWSKEKDSIKCPVCNISSNIHYFTFVPTWGFSNLGFTFWYWSNFTEQFIDEFRKKLGCEISIVYSRV